MRHQWVRMGYLASLIALVTLGLITGGGMSGPASLTDLAKAGTWVFAIVGYGQVILICLLAPLFMAGTIGSEQVSRTFDILLTTPLSNLQIVLGSLLGRLFFVLALLVSGLPLFAVLLIFGGVPIAAVFVCFVASAATALLVGSVAVALSVLRAGGRKIIYVFVISIAGYLVVSYLLDVFLVRPFSPRPNSTTWLTPLHPLLVVEASLQSADYRTPSYDDLGGYSALSRWYLSRPLAAFSMLAILGSSVLIVGSTLVLRRLAQSEGYLFEWLRLRKLGQQRHCAPRMLRGNPIAWREAHTRVHHAGGMIARVGFAVLGLGAAIAALWQYHHGQLPSNTFQLTFTTLLLVELAVIVLVALYMSASLMSSEREDGTLDLMLTTPITPKQYVWGKLSGLIRFLALLLAVPISTVVLVAMYALIGLIAQWPQATVDSPLRGPGGRVTNHMLMLIETPLLMTVTLVPFAAICVMIGLALSLKSQRVLSAVVPAVAFTGAFVVVVGFCGWTAAESIPIIGPIINAFSPATGLAMLINPWERIEGFSEDPIPGRMVLFVAALIAGTAYSLVVWAMLQSMVKGFDHTVRKLSGK